MKILTRKVPRWIFVPIAVVSLLTCPLTSAAKADRTPPEQKLDKIAAIIQGYLNQTDAAMSAAASALGKTGLSGPKARDILADLCNRWSGTVAVDCKTIDPSGVVVTVMPASFSALEGTNLISFSHISDAVSLKKPIMSGAFKPNKQFEGPYGASYIWPIFSPKGEFLGAVDILVKPIESIDEIIKPELGAGVADVWLLTPDGKVLYSHFHRQIGDSLLIIPTSVSGPTLAKLIKQIASQPEGSGSFTNAPVGHADAQVTDCIWKTASIHDIQRRIVLLMARSNG